MMEVTGVPLDELMAQARQVRDLTTGTRITYSPKVFIPLTMLCRDRCGYCTFAQPPARLDSPFLEPVRASFNTNTPIHWNRVHDLPDCVYFDHSIHISKGVGCTTCHGQVDKMPLMWQASTLQMSWCLDCHRNPERNVRPRDAVFRVDYQQPSSQNPVKVGETTYTDQLEMGKALVAEYQIQKLTSCSTCHR